MTFCILACLATAVLSVATGYVIGYASGRDKILALWRKSDHDGLFPPP